MSRQRRWAPVAWGGLCCLAMGMSACSSPADEGAPAPDPDVATRDNAGSTGGSNPPAAPASTGKHSDGGSDALLEDVEESLLPGKKSFAGSETCQQCHRKNYRRWTHDWHARALSKATSEAVVGRFNGAHYKGASSEAWMRHKGSQYLMRTAGVDGRVADWPISWVVGGKRMQDTVTQFDDGRWQILPVYYHVTGRGEWVDYNESKQGVVTPEHPFFWTNFHRMANRECLDCHVTGLNVTYDRETRHWTTDFVDAGVACESCHGPGARHSETEDKADIVNPGRLSKDLELAVCAQCHGPRNPLFPILDRVHRYQPGQKYEDSYTPMIVVDGRSRSGDYFADGRPSSSSFEYQALIQSQCYLKGEATCLSCHTPPHGDHAAGDLKRDPPAPGAEHTTSPGDETCRQCHHDIFDQGTTHTRHKSAAAQSCMACHMPKVVSGVLDHFADHALDIPAPQNTVRHDIPNACNTCHTKEKPEAMIDAMTRLWPDAATRQVRRILLADAIDEVTAAQSLPALLAVLADTAEAPALRGVAAGLLGQRFPQATPAAVLPLLNDPSVLVRTKALEALGFANARGVARHIAPLLKDGSLQVRHMAALVLSAFGDPLGERALQALEADPATEGLVQPHVLLGMAAARRGDFDTAAKELERGVDLMPYYTNALVSLADVYAKQGRYGIAHQRLEEALHFDPAHRGALDRLQALDAGGTWMGDGAQH